MVSSGVAYAAGLQIVNGVDPFEDPGNFVGQVVGVVALIQVFVNPRPHRQLMGDFDLVGGHLPAAHGAKVGWDFIW